MAGPPDEGATETATLCRLCGAFCGIVVTTVGEQMVRVRGDATHPASRGYTCGKGRALPAFHHDPARLDHPAVDGATSGWSDCLDDLARRISALTDAHGPDAVACYSGMGTYSDLAGMAAYQQLSRLLGTRQRYSAASVDVFPYWKACELVTGFPREANPMWEPEDSPDVCLVLGQNLVVAHGYAGCQLTNPVQRIRAFQDAGGELWVFDPRRTETAELADRHLQLRPDSDAVVLAWLVGALLTDGADEAELAAHADAGDVARLRAALVPFTLEVAAHRSGLPAGDLSDLLAAVRRSGRVACISGTGATFGRHAVVAEWLRWALLIVTGSLDRPGGMRFFSGFVAPMSERTDWVPAPPEGASGPGPATHPELASWLDELPCVAMVDEIEAGNVRALVVMGGNPLTAFPDPDRTAAALRSLDVLAVVDVLDKPLTQMATHVLPAAGMLEHDDLVTRDRASYTPRVVAPAAERRPAWWIFAQLGRRLGLGVLEGIDADSCTEEDVLRLLVAGSPAGDEVFAASPHGVVAPRRDGWVRERMLPGGRWRIAPRQLVARLGEVLATTSDTSALRLVSRRRAGNLNSVSYSHAPGSNGPEAPELWLHPSDAHDLAIEDAMRVQVTSAHGSLEAVARRNPRLARGVVSLTHGSHATNVNHLVSRTEDIDPLTGQPRMSGLAVTVSAAEGPGGG